MSVSASGGHLVLRLPAGLGVRDDLPAGRGVAHVGGAPATARPRQEAKAAPHGDRQALGQLNGAGD